MALFIPVGDAVTHGEQKMHNYFQRQLPPDWFVIGNLTICIGKLNRELDAVVIGSHCVWVVDDKAFSERITGDEVTWVLADGSHRVDELNKVIQAAKLLKGKFVNKHPHLKHIWVEGVITLSEDNVAVSVQDPRIATNVHRLKGCEKYFLNPLFKNIQSLERDDRETILRSLIGNLLADRYLSRSPDNAVISPVAAKGISKPIQNISKQTVYVQIDGEGGFRRVYYEDVVIGRNELRGAQPIDAVRDLEGTGIRLRFQNGRVLISPLNGLCDVVLEKRPVRLGEVLQFSKGTQALKIGEITLQVKVSEISQEEGV